MPIEVAPEAVGRSMALLGEHNLRAPQDVEAALDWICEREDADSPLLVTRYNLQIFLWYQLPRKFLAPIEDKQAVATNLARFLDQIGGRAREYAAICTSDQTMRMLEAWEEEGEAGELLNNALQASGIEPPDTDLIEWGRLMGPEEARTRDLVALEIERAVEDRRLDPEGRGFTKRRAELVDEFLQQPRAHLDSRAPIDLVGEERLERWLRRGSRECQAIVEPVAPLLRQPEQGEHESAARQEPLAPLAWLLSAAGDDGIALTQTGALNRSLVRVAVERFPYWWNSELFGPPHREDEVGPLCEVHDLASELRLLRRRGRKLLLTKQGQALRDDSSARLQVCVPHLIAGDGSFAGAVQELAVAVLLDRGTIDKGLLDAQVQAAIAVEGWHSGGEPPTVEAVGHATWGLIHIGCALELIDYEHEYNRELRSSRQDLTLTPVGRVALRLALRDRALGPAMSL